MSPDPLSFERWLEADPERAEAYRAAQAVIGEVTTAWLQVAEGGGLAAEPVGQGLCRLAALPASLFELGSALAQEPLLGWQPRGSELVRTFEAPSPALARFWLGLVSRWAACFGWRVSFEAEGATVRVALAGFGGEERQASRALCLSLLWQELERESREALTDFEEAVSPLLELSEVWPSRVH